MSSTNGHQLALPAGPSAGRPPYHWTGDGRLETDPHGIRPVRFEISHQTDDGRTVSVPAETNSAARHEARTLQELGIEATVHDTKTGETETFVPVVVDDQPGEPDAVGVDVDHDVTAMFVDPTPTAPVER
ncbi:hypothetical protein, partial [Saccharopolyspora shandongensis]|uniref:hypothetical protein n=1 Tax=Saccharopolyspora shandongensis TaxID=418495 RepID=UPI003406EC4E